MLGATADRALSVLLAREYAVKASNDAAKRPSHLPTSQQSVAGTPRRTSCTHQKA